MIKSNQDPRYSNEPLLLPRVWHGSRVSATSAEQLKPINLRETGIDLVVAANQPHNKMLRKMTKP
ncbi:MAG: hypothetical protein ACYC9L_06735 [Sulfuricaulis sp.]